MDKYLKIYLIFSGIFITILVIALLAIFTDEGREDKRLYYIHPDDPYLVKAKAKARQLLPNFIDSLNAYPEGAFIKIKAKESSVWVSALQYKDGYFTAQRVVRYEEMNTSDEVQFEVAEQEVEDWLIQYPDSLVWGGFTTQAIYFRQIEDYQDQQIDFYKNELKKFKSPL